MKIVVIASAVDHGTTTITNAFLRELDPCGTVLMKTDVRDLSRRAWINLRSEIMATTRSADVVLCLNHGAVIAGGLFVRHHRHQCTVGILEWTRQYPSRRKDWKTKLYAVLLTRILQRFTTVCSPVAGMRDFYASSARMAPIEYPLPYPEVTPVEPVWPIEGPVKALFIGADIRRKGGDILLNHWSTTPPYHAELSFVTPEKPEGNWDHVDFHHDIKPFTPEHCDLLKNHSVFILPSHRESYGYAALEALNFGQIVVTTQAAGIADLVRAAGGIVARTPEEAVHEALRLLGNRQEILERQKACHRFMMDYQKNFTRLMDDALDR